MSPLGPPASRRPLFSPPPLFRPGEEREARRVALLARLCPPRIQSRANDANRMRAKQETPRRAARGGCRAGGEGLRGAGPGPGAGLDAPGRGGDPASAGGSGGRGSTPSRPAPSGFSGKAPAQAGSGGDGGETSSLNPMASGGSPRGIARPEPSFRRSPREGWNPHQSIRPLLADIRSGFSLNPCGPRSGSTAVASIRPALRCDPKPRKANRTGFPFIETGFPFIGTGFRLNRSAEPSVHTAERMNGCAERSNRTGVPSKICGERLNARGFRLVRSPVRTNGTWE